MVEQTTPLLELKDVEKRFSSGGLLGKKRSVAALDKVSLTISRGEAVALVGESGSGKSTLARVVLKLVMPDSGAVLLDGRDEPASLAFRSRVQMIFQDPFASLNPVHTVLHHLARPLLRHKKATRGEVREKARALLETVGLAPAEEMLDRHPHQLSGGQRQRVAIARALAVEPDLLVADEPTSMLDVSLRAGILKLLTRLKRERGLAILLITHDLASARALADRIAVLNRGRIVEEGPARQVIDAPQHAYTRALLAAVATSPGD
jgi:peptide/nickel transport system ATP-binding protein